MNVVKIFYAFFLFVFLFIMLFSFSNCAGGGEINLPAEVCEYGNLACSISETLCEQNTIPQNICYYLQLSCLNLQYLCSDTLTTESRQVLLNYQKEINDLLIKDVLNK